jgi:peroxiredoxin
VHTPELPQEKQLDKVKKAVSRLDIDYPVLIDNDGTNWLHYGVEAWPTVFLIDKKGKVRRTWVGELGYDGADGFQQLSGSIQELLKEPG